MTSWSRSGLVSLCCSEASLEATRSRRLTARILPIPRAQIRLGVGRQLRAYQSSRCAIADSTRMACFWEYLGVGTFGQKQTA
jgi:hypothetical protein